MSNEELLNQVRKSNDIIELTYILKKTKWPEIPYYYLINIKRALTDKDEELVQDIPNYKKDILTIVLYFLFILINPANSILVCFLEWFLASTIGKIVAILKPQTFMKKGSARTIKTFAYYFQFQKIDTVIDIKQEENTIDYLLYKNESEQVNKKIYMEETKENKDIKYNILLIDQLNKCLEDDDLEKSLFRFNYLLKKIQEKHNVYQELELLAKYLVLIIEKYPFINWLKILSCYDDYFLTILNKYLCQITNCEEYFLISITHNNHDSIVKFLEALIETHLNDKKQEENMVRHK